MRKIETGHDCTDGRTDRRTRLFLYTLSQLRLRGLQKNIDVRVGVKFIVFNFLTIWMVSYIHVIV